MTTYTLRSASRPAADSSQSLAHLDHAELACIRRASLTFSIGYPMLSMCAKARLRNLHKTTNTHATCGCSLKLSVYHIEFGMMQVPRGCSVGCLKRAVTPPAWRAHQTSSISDRLKQPDNHRNARHSLRHQSRIGLDEIPETIDLQQFHSGITVVFAIRNNTALGRVTLTSTPAAFYHLKHVFKKEGLAQGMEG